MAAFGKGPFVDGPGAATVSPATEPDGQRGIHVHGSDNRHSPRRTGEGKSPVGIHGSGWSSIRGRTAAATAGMLLLAGSPVAHGEPSDPAFPSRQEVDAARERAADTARSVQAIQADYAAAGQHLESLGIAAAQAAEA